MTATAKLVLIDISRQNVNIKLMRRLIIVILGLVLLSAPVVYLNSSDRLPKIKKTTMDNHNSTPGGALINLPSPNFAGQSSLEESILKRRSRRSYGEKPLTVSQVSQILWAGQGITDQENKFRSAPSAGALYPLDLYLVVGEKKVKSLLRESPIKSESSDESMTEKDYLDSGVYHYLPQNHQLEKILDSDLREEVMKASLHQSFIAEAPVVLVITAEYERTTQKYGERGKIYVHIEAGHVGQNICLQVASLGLGTVTIGAFNEKEIADILNLPATYHPLYVMPIGYPK